MGVVAVTATSCIGVSVANPICEGVSGIGSAIFGTGANAALNAMASWVGDGASWLLNAVGGAMASSTAIHLQAPWFITRYQAVEGILGVVALPLLLAAAIHALFRQSPGLIVRAAIVQLPLAMVLAGAAVELVTMALAITDQLCAAISGTTPGALSSLTHSLAGAVVNDGTAGGPGAPAFIVLLGAVVAALAALVLWIELILRAAAIYVAVAFLPLVLITMVWPALTSWSRRLVETLVALILSKLVVVLVLDMAVGAMGTTNGRSFSTVVTGIALLLLASFAPFTLLKLMPIFESSAAGHLEGLRQRGTASVMTGAPRRAVDMAMAHAQATPSLAVPDALSAAVAGAATSSSTGDGLDVPPPTSSAGEHRTEDPMTTSAAGRAGSGSPPPPPITAPVSAVASRGAPGTARASGAGGSPGVSGGDTGDAQSGTPGIGIPDGARSDPGSHDPGSLDKGSRDVGLPALSALSEGADQPADQETAARPPVAPWPSGIDALDGFETGGPFGDPPHGAGRLSPPRPANGAASLRIVTDDHGPKIVMIDADAGGVDSGADGA